VDAVTRCDSEIGFYSALNDRAAYLVAMAINDWETEKRLIASEARTHSEALASVPPEDKPLRGFQVGR
jgi:hypothetical protein